MFKGNSIITWHQITDEVDLFNLVSVYPGCIDRPGGDEQEVRLVEIADVRRVSVADDLSIELAIQRPIRVRCCDDLNSDGLLNETTMKTSGFISSITFSFQQRRYGSIRTNQLANSG